jgi:hypothetical protein
MVTTKRLMLQISDIEDVMSSTKLTHAQGRCAARKAARKANSVLDIEMEHITLSLERR